MAKSIYEELGDRINESDRNKPSVIQILKNQVTIMMALSLSKDVLKEFNKVKEVSSDPKS